MSRREIPVADLTLAPFSAWDKKWFLLAAGEKPARRL